MRLLVANSTQGGNVFGNARDQAKNTYVEFLATQPSSFTEVGEPLEADHWLRVIESKFGLLHCTENQKTLFTTQQLLDDAGTWWANFTTTCPTDQV
jgi:hypothetical protein